MADLAMTASPDALAAAPVRGAPPGHATGEVVFRFACAAAATLLMAALAGVVISLFIGGLPAFRQFGFGFLTSTVWNPVTDVYGAAGPIVGTLVTAFLALLVALRAVVQVTPRHHSPSSCTPWITQDCGNC